MQARVKRLLTTFVVPAISVCLSGAAARAQEPPETSLYLIGDAGAPAPAGEPVLRALGELARADAERAIILFLGDNVYKKGLPPETSPESPEALRRIDAQIDVVLQSGARGIFIPGNHDWAIGSDDGWEAVKRQERRIETRGAKRAEMLPDAGCPGPVIIDQGERLRLIIIDTSWWLHEGIRPEHPTSTCACDSEQEVLAALRSALQSAGTRATVVLAHHPIASGGPHGAQFGWTDHIFPLRALNRWLWIPLPGIGSAYPIARTAGAARQDLSSVPYKQMIGSLRPVLESSPPVIYASGHDHNLQVIKDGKAAEYLLVSGAGIFGEAERAERIGGTQFASSEAGFMKLDIFRDGGIRLTVIAADAEGKGREIYKLSIRPLTSLD